MKRDRRKSVYQEDTPEKGSRASVECASTSRQGWAGPKKLTRVAAPSPRASLGRRTVCGRTEQRRPPVSKRYETKVRMVWGSFLIAIAAAALKTPTRDGYNAQGVNLTFLQQFPSTPLLTSRRDLQPLDHNQPSG